MLYYLSKSLIVEASVTFFAKSLKVEANEIFFVTNTFRGGYCNILCKTTNSGTSVIFLVKITNS